MSTLYTSNRNERYGKVSSRVETVVTDAPRQDYSGTVTLFLIVVAALVVAVIIHLV